MKYFEILGITKTWYGSASKVYPEQIQVDRHGKETKVTKLKDRKSTRLNSSHNNQSRMPSSA